MIGSIAIAAKQKALAELASMSEQLAALAVLMVEQNRYPAKEHVEAAWRCIQYATQAVEQSK